MKRRTSAEIVAAKEKKVRYDNNTKYEHPFRDYLIFAGFKFEMQYMPVPGRKFRSDFYIPKYNLIIEIEGGIWMSKGRHTTGTGFSADIRKYNAIVLQGYKVIRFSGDDFMRIGKDLYTVSSYIKSTLDAVVNQHEEAIGKDSSMC